MNECIPMEALGELDSLSPDDPRRRHVDRCPRCGALAFAYSEFMRTDPVAGAHVDDADTRLEAFIAARIAVRGAAAPTSGGASRWFELLSLRPAWALAAAVLVLSSVAVLRWQPWRSDEIVYRGAPSSGISVGAPRDLGDGRVELTWSPVRGAESYVVMILSKDLGAIAARETTSASLVVDLGALASDGPAFLQVTALLDGDVIAESPPVPVPSR